MIEIIIVFFLFTLLLKIVDYPNVKKLKKSTNLDDSMILRKKIKKNRIITFSIYLFLYVIIFIKTKINTISSDNYLSIIRCVYSLIIFPFSLYIYLVYLNTYKRMMGIISVYKKEDFLQKYNNYALYLRGFENDIYKKYIKINDKGNSKFSEFEFTLLLQKKIQTCAVGMTKEADSPIGATRIYLNDDTWKEDVEDLMHKSICIYILIDDRESCIWEIEQSSKLLEKTTFIVDDITKYNNVREKLKHIIPFPKIDDNRISETKIAILNYINNSFETNIYVNNISGYSQILHVDIPDFKNNKIRKTITIISLYTILGMSLFIGSYSYIEKKSYEEIQSIKKQSIERIIKEKYKTIDYLVTLSDFKEKNDSIICKCYLNDYMIDIKTFSKDKERLKKYANKILCSKNIDKLLYKKHKFIFTYIGLSSKSKFTIQYSWDDIY